MGRVKYRSALAAGFVVALATVGAACGGSDDNDGFDDCCGSGHQRRPHRLHRIRLRPARPLPRAARSA